MTMRYYCMIMCVLTAALWCAAAGGEEVVNEVVAVVNGVPLTSYDTFQGLEEQVQTLNATYAGDELAMRVLRLEFQRLQQKIDEMLLLDEAERTLTEMDKQRIDESVEDQIKTRIFEAGSKVKFEDTLAKQGMTLEKLKTEIRKQLMINAIIQKEVSSKATLVPEELLDYYNEHKTEFATPEKVQFRQIVISFSDYTSKEDAMAQAMDIHDKAAAGGDFAALAERYSSGPKAGDGGLWDYVTRGELKYTAIEDAAFSLEAGGVSEVIETDVGYHIIKIEDKVAAVNPSFDEVQDTIRSRVHQQKVQALLREFLQRLKENSSVRLTWSKLSEIEKLSR